MPRISVLMSVFNGERFLEEAVGSILCQDFQDFEFIIVDDGSKDRTWSILTSFRDRRVHLIQNVVNIGLTKSLNRGLSVASGDYVARQDADDVSLLQRLGVQAAYLAAHPTVAMVSGNVEYIDSNGQVTGRTDRRGSPELIAWHMLFRNYIPAHGQVMFRRDVVKAMGGYNESCRYSQDYELWTRLVRNHRVVILPDLFLQWRRHSANISTAQRALQVGSFLAAMTRNLGWWQGHAWTSMKEAAELSSLWRGEFWQVQNPVRVYGNTNHITSCFLRAQTRMIRARLRLQLKTRIRLQFWKLSRYYGWRSRAGIQALYCAMH